MKNRIGFGVVLIVVIVLLNAALVSAQEPPRPPQQPPDRDPFGEAMFPPELVMQHQREIGLTDEQKAFMRAEIQKATTRFNELQWQLQDAGEALGESMKGNSVNEQQALAQLDKVLDTEREIKHLHVALAIRIKNKLTPEQQAKLQGMRRMPRPGEGPDGGPGRGRGPGGPERGPEPGPAPRPAGPPRPDGEPQPDGAPL
jgi:Spy/CpxP family protein refolding chaperone